MLEVENVSCGYRQSFMLKDVSFSVMPGEVFGIIGPNGAGKTTLFRMISGLLKPIGGTASFNGKDLASVSLQELAQTIAVVPQNPALYQSMTVQEYVLLGRTPYVKRWQFMESNRDHDLVRQAMRITDIEKLAWRQVDSLSGGERQLAVIAKALAQEPKLILLDEPTNHLDITHQARILDLVARLTRDKGVAVLIVLHNLNLASEYCDRLLLMDNGREYTSGAPQDVITYQTIEAVYHTPVVVKKNPLSGKPYVFLVSERMINRDTIHQRGEK